MKKTIGFITVITILGIMASLEIKAQNVYSYDQMLDKAYETFAIEQQDSLTIMCNEDISGRDFITDIAERHDKEEDLYDGYVLASRLNIDKMTMLRSDEDKNIIKYTINVTKKYDPEEADELTDKMIKAIEDKYGTDLSERNKTYAIMEYIADKYDYDYEGEEIRDRINKKEVSNSEDICKSFVEAYYGDGKIVCTDYAAITYILAKKMGLNCEIVSNQDAHHMYNIIKFSDMDDYMILDTACENKNAIIGKEDMNYNIDYYKTGRISKPFTGRYNAAPLWEVIKAEAHFLFKDLKEGKWL